MIELALIGNLGKDAEVKRTESWNITNFSVAATVGFGDKKKTIWVNCAKFDKAGNDPKLAEYLTKGTKVFIKGTPKASAYESNGEAKASLEVAVNYIELLSNTGNTGNDPQPKSEPSNDDDLPW